MLALAFFVTSSQDKPIIDNSALVKFSLLLKSINHKISAFIEDFIISYGEYFLGDMILIFHSLKVKPFFVKFYRWINNKTLVEILLRGVLLHFTHGHERIALLNQHFPFTSFFTLSNIEEDCRYVHYFCS